jgi:transcriptional regulator with XRE-family HTH domain
MTTQKQIKAPDRFLLLLEKAMKEHPDKLSLREVARRADISPGYLSRLLSGERSAPSNDAIAQLERVLNIPDHQLFKAAARPNDKALEFFRKDEAGTIISMLSDVPTSQLPAVRKYLGRFIRIKKDTKAR